MKTEEINIRDFLESQDITKSYQTIMDKNWNEVTIESLLIAFKEYTPELLNPVNEELKKLRHHRDTTVGLWATDRPDLVNDPKNIMFRLTDY